LLCFFAIAFYIEDGDHTNGNTPMVASLGLMPRQLTTQSLTSIATPTNTSVTGDSINKPCNPY